MAVLNRHPNATVAGSSGGLTVLLVWLLSLLGVNLSPEIAAGVATGAATVVLLIGREGVVGLAHTIWRGQG